MSELESPPPQVVQQIVTSPRPSGSWQLDKSIGITVILAVLAQCVIGIWYASGAYAQLADHERRIVHLEQAFEERTKLRDEQMKALNDMLSELRERLAGIEASLKILSTDQPRRR